MNHPTNEPYRSDAIHTRWSYEYDHQPTVNRLTPCLICGYFFAVNDFEYARSGGINQIAYGTAGDCYSAMKCPQGRFSINLTNTGFRLSNKSRWRTYGGSHSYQFISGLKVRNKLCGCRIKMDSDCSWWHIKIKLVRVSHLQHHRSLYHTTYRIYRISMFLQISSKTCTCSKWTTQSQTSYL